MRQLPPTACAVRAATTPCTPTRSACPPAFPRVPASAGRESSRKSAPPGCAWDAARCLSGRGRRSPLRGRVFIAAAWPVGIGAVVAALGGEVEVVVGAEQGIEPAGVGGVGEHDRAVFIPGEDAQSRQL